MFLLQCAKWFSLCSGAPSSAERRRSQGRSRGCGGGEDDAAPAGGSSGGDASGTKGGGGGRRGACFGMRCAAKETQRRLRAENAHERDVWVAMLEHYIERVYATELTAQQARERPSLPAGGRNHGATARGGSGGAAAAERATVAARRRLSARRRRSGSGSAQRAGKQSSGHRRRAR